MPGDGGGADTVVGGSVVDVVEGVEVVSTGGLDVVVAASVAGGCPSVESAEPSPEHEASTRAKTTRSTMQRRRTIGRLNAAGTSAKAFDIPLTTVSLPAAKSAGARCAAVVSRRLRTMAARSQAGGRLRHSTIRHAATAIVTLALVAAVPGLARASTPGPFEPEGQAVRDCPPHPDIWGPVAERVPGALVAAIDEALADERLHNVGLGLSIWVEGYGEVEAVNGDLRLKPASNQKLLTAISALEVLGPDYRLETKVVTDGLLANGVLDGDLYLVGGGDATLTSAGDHSLATLAAAVRDAGVRSIGGRILGDESHFDDLREAVGWRELNIPESMGSLSALTVDENRYRADWPFIAEPTPYNAALFRVALDAAGVDVTGVVATEGTAPSGAAEVARLRSPPVRSLVAEMLTESDNMIAEMLTKEMGLVTSGVGSTVDGVAAMRQVVADLCLANSVLQHDGSGLSHANARSARGWRSLLQAAQTRPWWPLLLDGLAVAGETGTLERRFVDTAAAGNLRAKTGTISGIRALSGVMTTAGGRRVIFSVIVDDDVDPRGAMAAIDDLLVVLAEDES